MEETFSYDLRFGNTAKNFREVWNFYAHPRLGPLVLILSAVARTDSCYVLDITPEPKLEQMHNYISD